MKKQNFTRLCVLTSILGLGIMYASTQVFQPSKVDIGEISKKDVGETVRIEGKISGFYSTESASFFNLEAEGSNIPVTDFQNRKFPEGTTVILTGQVDLYQGDLQVVASKIERKIKGD